MEPRLQGRDHSLCADYLNTDLCPCVLAEIKRCPICSHLQGKNLCDCEWVGTCILQNYQYGQFSPFILPQSNNCQIVKAFQISPDGILLYLYVSSKALAEFNDFTILKLKYSNPPVNVRVPAIVTEVFKDKNIIEVAAFAPDLKNQHILKTQDIFSLETTNNQGILGLTPLSYINNSKVLVLAKDFGTLLIPSLIRFLQKSENQVTVATAKLHPFLKNKINALAPLLEEYITLNQDIEVECKKSYSYICSLTSAKVNKILAKALEKGSLNIPLAVLNTEIFPII